MKYMQFLNKHKILCIASAMWYEFMAAEKDDCGRRASI